MKIFRRKNCKFCGRKPQMKHFRTRWGWRYYVYCKNCYCGHAWHDRLKEVAKATAVELYNNHPRKFRDGILEWVENRQWR